MLRASQARRSGNGYQLGIRCCCVPEGSGGGSARFGAVAFLVGGGGGGLCARCGLEKSQYLCAVKRLTLLTRDFVVALSLPFTQLHPTERLGAAGRRSRPRHPC